MLKICYIRVSTEEQNEERQIVAMREQGIELQNTKWQMQLLLQVH